MAQHVERLFSEAYDSMLPAAARARFEEHLAGCAQCRAAYDDYRVALFAVGELPAARMPVAVVLPASPPQVEMGAISRWRALLAALRQPRAMAAAAGLAAVGVAAVTIAVRVNHGSNSPTLALGGTSSNTVPAQLFAPNNPNGAAAGGAVPQCSPSAEPGSAPVPSSFANSKVVNDSSRPGEQLVVATERQRYGAGSTVLVYARLVTPHSAAPAYLPCVTLHGPPSSAVSAAPQNASADDFLKGITASPTSAGDVTSAPLLTVTIPPGTPAGTVLHIVAQIPVNVPSTADSTPLVADLTIIVT
jgi:hypothetical protein